MTSSIPSPQTGSRLNPFSIASSTTSAMLSDAETVIMSVRGTITSRATVSPSSRTDSIRSRSSSSVSVPSAAFWK